jgi:hypothetical protein
MAGSVSSGRSGRSTEGHAAPGLFELCRSERLWDRLLLRHAGENDPKFPHLQLGNKSVVNTSSGVSAITGKGVNAVGDVNAVISANVNEGSSHSHVSTRSRQRIVQRSGRTKVTEERETNRGGDNEPAAGQRDRD